MARQIDATARLKARLPATSSSSGSAYSYLQEWLPARGAARGARRARPTSSASAGMVLSYPELPADVLAGAPLQRKAHLPHLQRLHDRAAQRPRLGLLSRSTPSTRAVPTPRGCGGQGSPGQHERRDGADPRHQALAVATAFLALFSIVGFALYGLPFFYDFFVEDLGWTRQQVTSGQRLQQARGRAAVRLPGRDAWSTASVRAA